MTTQFDDEFDEANSRIMASDLARMIVDPSDDQECRRLLRILRWEDEVIDTNMPRVIEIMREEARI